MRILHQRLVYLAGVALFAAVTSAPAQDLGTLNPTPLPPLAKPDSPKTLAKELFARKATPVPGIARSIGTYNDIRVHVLHQRYDCVAIAMSISNRMNQRSPARGSG